LKPSRTSGSPSSEGSRAFSFSLAIRSIIAQVRGRGRNCGQFRKQSTFLFHALLSRATPSAVSEHSATVQAPTNPHGPLRRLDALGDDHPHHLRDAAITSRKFTQNSLLHRK
jgi:hypothetical protein